MDQKDVLELLARHEGVDLDFKATPYSDAVELAKDVMSMANLLPKGQRAHILLGVPEDAHGGAGAPVDVGHVDDAGYHQMVDGKLNRTPQFAVVRHKLESGVTIGIVEVVGEGKRPYYPKTAKGGLTRHVPLKRDGSSTTVATPDDVIEWYLQDNPVTPSVVRRLGAIPPSACKDVRIRADLLNAAYSLARHAMFFGEYRGIDLVEEKASVFITLAPPTLVKIPLECIEDVAELSDGWTITVRGAFRQNGATGHWEFHKVP